MEILIELVVAVATFIFEVTVHALVFVFLLVMAIFSPRYRQRVREKWNVSGWERFSIVIGISLYSIALVVALLVWIPLLWAEDTGNGRDEPSIVIEFSSDELEEMKKTKKIQELADVAEGLIKRRLEERKKGEENVSGE